MDSHVSTQCHRAKHERSKVLDLSCLGLLRWSAAIFELSELQILKLNDNSLTEVPPMLTNLHQLRVLDISNNKIKQLPTVDFRQMQSLTSIRLEGNPVANTISTKVLRELAQPDLVPEKSPGDLLLEAARDPIDIGDGRLLTGSADSAAAPVRSSREPTVEAEGQGGEPIAPNFARFADFVMEEDGADPVVNLARNNIDNQAAEVLAAGLALNTSVTALDLAENSIGNQGVHSFAEALVKNRTLRSLNLTRNRLGDQAAENLAVALDRNGTLTAVNLASNRIGEHGAHRLAAVLRKNAAVTTLVLSGNPIGAEGAACLAATLESNRTLTSLDISNTDIGALGGRNIALALKKNTSLMSINLAGNNVSDLIAVHLASALQTHPALTDINLAGNKIGRDGSCGIARVLATSTTLAACNLAENAIDDHCASIFSSALDKNRFLTTIIFDGNYIGDEGGSCVAAALENNLTVTTLSLDRNKVGKVALRRIENLLRRNQAGTRVLTVTCEKIELGKLALVCTGLDGTTVAAISLSPSTRLRALREAVRLAMKFPGILQLALSDGTLLEGEITALGTWFKPRILSKECDDCIEGVDGAA